MVLGAVIGIGFTVTFMCALHRWLTAESNEITQDEQLKPQAKVQKQGA